MIKKLINPKKKKKVINRKLAKGVIVPKKISKKRSINIAFEFRTIDFKADRVRYILGIDPSLSSTGICLYDLLEKKMYVDSIQIKLDICLCEGDRYDRIGNAICGKLNEWGDIDFTNTICFMEQPSAMFGSGFKQLNVMEFVGVVKMVLAKNFLVVPLMISSSTIRGFHEFGKLKDKDKKEYVIKINEKFIVDGLNAKNDDECDAFLAMKIAGAFFDGDIGRLTSNQIGVLYEARDKIIYQILNAEEKTEWNKEHKKEKKEKVKKGEENG